MDTKDIPDEKPSPWIPLLEPVELAMWAKLGEELAECSAIVARIIAQGGLMETEPETGKPNVDALEEEIADVYGMFDIVTEAHALDENRMSTRQAKKTVFWRQWFDGLRHLYEKKDS